jgi:dolichyl-phosphate beta-glucosyltransferase
MKAFPSLSIIIPCYNAGKFLKDSVQTLRAYLQTLDVSFEIVLVNDGSTDNTRALLNEWNISPVTVVDLSENQGKFGALKAGMIAARGRVKIFTDADLPFDLEAIRYAYSLLNEGSFHIVVGDRTLPESDYYQHIPFHRFVLSRLFSSYIRLLITGGVFDTQCGFKAFRSDVADGLFEITLEKGFSGDVEVIYLALKHNLPIRRIPVRLRRTRDSSIHLASHALQMAWSVLSLPLRWHRGRYKSEVLNRLSSQRYWENKK